MRVKTIEDKQTKLYYNEEINEEHNCIEINLHVENYEDLNIITNEILNLRDNYKFSKPAITRGDY